MGLYNGLYNSFACVLSHVHFYQNVGCFEISFFMNSIQTQMQYAYIGKQQLVLPTVLGCGWGGGGGGGVNDRFESPRLTRLISQMGGRGTSKILTGIHIFINNKKLQKIIP